jgi:hypothetical protein
MPDAFRAVLLACLHINPSFRPSLGQLSDLLETARPSKPDISSAAEA